MKKVLLFFLFSGVGFAGEINYSLKEMFTKIVESKTLTPSGKVFLMGYFEDMEPILFKTDELTQTLCSEAGTELFLPSNKGCEENLVRFLTKVDKSGRVDAGVNVDVKPGEGPVISIRIGGTWEFK
jgi:hypothetical protein